jgi:CNT family concentrative nucleoside transporter
MAALQAALGVVAMCAFAWAISERRRVVPWKPVLVGLALQVALVLLLLYTPPARAAFLWLNAAVDVLQAASDAGTRFVFGYLGGGEPPFAVKPGASTFILASQALPLVLVISALSALLYHWRVLPAIVAGFAWALRKTMDIGGPAGMSTAANVFVGMVEAPLLIRPYLAGLSRSDLFLVMTGGMASIAGTVLVVYAQFLKGVIPDPVGHLLTASILSAPATIVISRLMIPETDARGLERPTVLGRLYDGAMDAIVKGTADGLSLLLNIVAMLVVLAALVYLANAIIGLLPMIDGAPLTLQRMLGWALGPLAWLLGIPWAEAGAAGALLGTKVVLNEFMAYAAMSQLPADALSPHSRLIMAYALCGFANFGSLGIMIGGMGAMAPERRGEIIGLGMKSIVSGTLATALAAAVVGAIARSAGGP